MKQGIYEEIINQQLKNELETLDLEEFEIGTEQIDPEEARKLLSTYISAITRKALKFVRDNGSDGNQALMDQIRTCNFSFRFGDTIGISI
ncbi:hypothetical protein [Bacillus sp. FJAT-27251]|uniref:hypothetical protein n=1 Tax=Bacillus sp. FJAT-27251 TaxID=1684142 RepID=UPI0006A76B34|nr:hypothetical protein [Bacillus sp. FJAT-27251]